MATVNEAQVLAGHTAKIMIDGVEAGWMQGVTWNLDFGVQDVRVIGSIETQEHQQTQYNVTGEIQRHYVRDMLIETSKLGARTAVELINTGTFDLIIMDAITQQPIQVLEACTLASGSSGVQAGQLVSRRLGFRALRTR